MLRVVFGEISGDANTAVIKVANSVKTAVVIFVDRFIFKVGVYY